MVGKGYMSIKLPFFIERNELSFIETSALDSTNVEVAFRNILEGKFLMNCFVNFCLFEPTGEFKIFQIFSHTSFQLCTV